MHWIGNHNDQWTRLSALLACNIHLHIERRAHDAPYLVSLFGAGTEEIRDVMPTGSTLEQAQAHAWEMVKAFAAELQAIIATE